MKIFLDNTDTLNFLYIFTGNYSHCVRIGKTYGFVSVEQIGSMLDRYSYYLEDNFGRTPRGVFIGDVNLDENLRNQLPEYFI